MLKVFVAVAAALAIVPTALAGKAVPSLTPAATHRLWVAEVARAKAHPRALADASCRPARAIFYAQTDWLRLATKLAAQPSPCAQYYVSVPPLAADKTQARANQAAQIRALGSSFHALDEISWNGWSGWVAGGNGSWYDAGVLARQRMAAAGFDASAGDTWALNELSSAVRAGTGSARANALEFMRGLASDGVKGVVFVAGVSQTISDGGTYKVNLQNWLTDDGFWGAAAQYAGDWAQENYGDIRAYAVAGATPQQRRDAEVQYLGHELALANANPDAEAASRAFLASAYVAFGNAAWAWSSSYGWTAAPVATMLDFVSGQVYAARSLGAPSGVDRLGFAWAPSNTLGLTTADYNTQTGSVLDRIAASIRDSGASVDAACSTFCTTSVDGAAFSTAWQQFSAWSTPALAFTSAPPALEAGASTQLTVQIETAGVPQNAAADETVTFASTSPTGTFSPSATVTIPAGSSTATVTYTDTHAGSATVSAAPAGQAPVTQPVTVVAAALAKLAVAPAAATLVTGASVKLVASGSDAYGNAVSVAPAWSLSTTAYGRLSGTTFTASKKAGRVVVTASTGGVSGTATITVVRRAAHVTAGTKSVAGHLVVTAKVERGSVPAAGVPLLLRVRKGSSTVAIVKGTTGRSGRLVWRSHGRLPRARYVVRAAIRSASTASRTKQSRT